MRFWDSSAVVALLVREPGSGASRDLLRSDRELIVWWGTELECVSAISRRERDGDVDAAGAAAALERLDDLRSAWTEVQPGAAVRRDARRLMRVHPLRTLDALQLAAALVGSDHQPATLSFVCMDHRLADAARREGFGVLGLEP